MNIKKQIIQNRNHYYQIGRLFPVLIIGPFLFCKGVNNNDNSLIVIGILLIVWDGLKLIYK